MTISPETDSATTASAAGPALRAEHVYKVFGRRPDEAVKRLREGADADDVKDLGTAAVIDATFDVAPGEIFVVMGLSGSGTRALRARPPTQRTIIRGDFVYRGCPAQLD